MNLPDTLTGNTISENLHKVLQQGLSLFFGIIELYKDLQVVLNFFLQKPQCKCISELNIVRSFLTFENIMLLARGKMKDN